MDNARIAQIFREMGEYLAMKNIPFKPRAYERAAQIIASLEEELRITYEKGGTKALREIPGIGASIAEHIEELLKTGRLREYEKLKKGTPVDLSALTRVEGLGPKKIKILYEKLDITTLDKLEKAARTGKIRKLEGFGATSEEKILNGIAFAKSAGERFLLGTMIPEIKSIMARLKTLKEIDKVELAGSARRKKETIGDADILATSHNPEHVMKFFTSQKEVARIVAQGPTKSTVKLKSGLSVDLRVVPPESFGAALQYFTGSKDHNVALRGIAQRKGYKLNEYGLFQIADQRGSKRGLTQKEIRVAGKDEKEIYKILGFDYIEPELRENTGELEAALRQAQGKHLRQFDATHHKQAQGELHGLPKLIGYQDLRGDLQVQTSWTDGEHSIEQMAYAAIEAGLEYIAITDHTKRLTVTHGLDDERLLEQMKAIDELNKKIQKTHPRFRILKGTECDILKDGTLDISDEVLKQLDIVGISVHSHFTLPREEQTKRVIRAMQNPHADILFHPTGRLINRRPAIDIDMD